MQIIGTGEDFIRPEIITDYHRQNDCGGDAKPAMLVDSKSTEPNGRECKHITNGMMVNPIRRKQANGAADHGLSKRPGMSIPAKQIEAVP
jgi:hypothetical protein